MAAQHGAVVVAADSIQRPPVRVVRGRTISSSSGVSNGASGSSP